MGSKTLNISGFPLGTTAGEAKQFLETNAGIGTVFAVKIRSRVTVYAIVQFTTREAAEIIRERASGDLRLGHHRLIVNPARDIVPRPRIPLFELDGITLHLGCPLSADRLSVLFSGRNVRLNFSRNLRKIVLFLSWSDRSYKLECSYESIWEIRRHNSPTQLQDFLVLLVVAAPRIYTLPNQGSLFDGPTFNYFKDPDHDERWIRTTDFTESCCIGEASAICLELPLEYSLPDISQMFAFYKETSSPLRLEPGLSFSQDLELVPIVRPREGISVPYETLFKVNHMVQNGTLSGPTLDDDFFLLLDPGLISQSFIDRALERLSYSKTCCFSPSSWLKGQYEKMGKSKQHGTASRKISLQPGLVYVHRAQVTPSKVYFFGPEVNVSNRVIRHFKRDLENFMRVSFVDEEGEKLRSVDLQPRQIAGSSDKQTELYRRLQSTLRNGISVGGKRFEFLAFSSSQLKDSSVWMFASRPGLCAADIRRWMGDFSSIRNVAKYAARLGQSFGSSTETLSVARHEIEMIPDVENHKGYVFSDGIGKISAAFARQVAKKCNLSMTPSAFQIRYGGFKGVVAVDPTSRVKLSLRKSMCKFESSNTKLDMLAHSKPQVCFLNRQLITLLSTLGVRDEVFLRKQEELVAKLDETLTDPARAMEILSAINPGEMAGILKDMLSCGYVPREEPFLSMMLQTFRAAKLNELRTKSRIFIPMGRSMMGCMDETSTLEYGQVFVQVSSSSSSYVLDGLEMFQESSSNGSGSGIGSVIITGKVVVSKNPCLHPGNLRVLQAIDVPSLHHMVDCVVFPQKGKRPHPNECSGSDLDGDIYFVSWDPELIPPHQVEPMDYTPAPQTSLDRDVIIEDIEEYFVNYLVNDSLGVIANAHTVFADREPQRAMSPHCRDLAKLFSIAVDFPKTGVPAVIPPHLTVKEYPDFMEKHDKMPYRSNGVIGKLFRVARDKDPSSVPLEFTHREASRCYDPDMEINGFENYLDEAFFLKGEYDFKLGNLMDLYKIKTEAEILFGGSTKLSKGFNRQRDADAVRLAMKSLKKEVRSWFNQRSREDNLDEDSLLAKASAWYHVTYHRDYWGCYDEGLVRPHFLSFPWCIHDKLISIKERKNADRLSTQLAAMRIRKQTKKRNGAMWREKRVVL